MRIDKVAAVGQGRSSLRIRGGENSSIYRQARVRPCLSTRLYRERHLVERIFAKLTLLRQGRHPLHQARCKHPCHGPALLDTVVAARL